MKENSITTIDFSSLSCRMQNAPPSIRRDSASSSVPALPREIDALNRALAESKQSAAITDTISKRCAGLETKTLEQFHQIQALQLELEELHNLNATLTEAHDGLRTTVKLQAKALGQGSSLVLAHMSAVQQRILDSNSGDAKSTALLKEKALLDSDGKLSLVWMGSSLEVTDEDTTMIGELRDLHALQTIYSAISN